MSLRPRFVRPLAALLAAASALAGCAVGPDYQPPHSVAATAPTGFVNASADAVNTAPLPDGWWRLFADPVLDRLVPAAIAHNTDVREAAANLAEARALLSEARSLRLPSTTAQASATRNRVSTRTGSTGGVLPGGPNVTLPDTITSNFYSVGFDANYEIDLFGGVSRSIEAALANRESAAATLDAVRSAVAAETARSYALACGYAARVEVAAETVRLQERTLDLTRRLLQGGSGTQREVDQATVLAEQARAQLPALDAERRAALASLAVLTGAPPAEVDAAAVACSTPPRVAGLLPVGDGAALLARRADVRSAERQLAAATARIGIATADLYPRISFLGSAALGSTGLSNLSDAGSFTYSLGPLISWSFPNLSAARARVRQAEAQEQATLARFDGVVLTALQEVESALARYKGALDANAALTRAEAASSNAARLSRLRFDAGSDSFLQLIDAERDRANARSALAQSNAEVAEAQVSLFKALGGGWENAPEPTRRAP